MKSFRAAAPKTFAFFAAAFAVSAVSLPARSIVIRHDAKADAYIVADDHYKPLADLPGEGHGVLISDRWVVTAAHATQGPEPIASVTIGGKSRAVAGVTVHPGFKPPPSGMTGDAAPVMAILLAMDDIALILLAEPVTDVEPAQLYRGDGEAGEVAEILGKGASGDGVIGQRRDDPRRGPLRRAFNRIESAEGRWLTYRFDQGDEGLPLEGMLGNGDSGGPVLIRDQDGGKLAGLASWKWWTGDIADFKAGHYGQVSYQTRLSHYADWVESVIGGH